MHRLTFLYVLLAAFAAIVWTGCETIVDPPPAEADPTLRALAEERGFYIGAAVGTGLQAREAAYAEVLAREFNMLTAENAMKFGPLRPSAASFDFTDADALVAFAEAHDMAVRGHTLVWHNQNPGWLTNGNRSREQMIDILEEHVATVVGRYKGRIAAWDVVNEAVADDGSLRNTIWLQTIGPDYLDIAFRAAHAADPEALLFYNDYGAEGSGRKADGVYALVTGLRSRGVPIHGVGMQMHVSTDFAPGAAQVAANMERLGRAGLDVHITEMDVRMPLPPTGTSLVRQAVVYETMLGVCLEALNCTSFVLWGFTDRYSWIPQTFTGQGAGLIFDESYTEKLAYEALREVLSGSAE